MRVHRPNIVLITTHDSGRFFGCYGNRSVHTPWVDRLAADGVRLTNYFATVPICSASRATMLTGRYPQSNGLMDLIAPSFGWRLGYNERHAARIISDAGYDTLLFGLQHEALDVERLGSREIRAQQGSDGMRLSAEDVARDFDAFLKTRTSSDAPFYAQIGFFETHTPFDWRGTRPDTSRGVTVPPYLIEDEFTRDTVAQLQGMLRRADAAVGMIMEALDASGLADDTLFIFTTDHGVELPRAKWHLYDPGVAIALVMRWPNGGIVGGRTCDSLIGNVDFLPTVLELAGIEPESQFEGVSFAANLIDDTAQPPRDAVYGLYQKTEVRSIRTDRHKLIQHFATPIDYLELPVCVAREMQKRAIPSVELFDLQRDPLEFENVVDKPEYAEIRDELRDRLWRWLESVNDPILQGPIVTPSYQRAHDDYIAWKNRTVGA